MKILMISPECAPFSKVGGLADMVSALSKQLAGQGHDVKIFTPLYSCVKKDDSFKKAVYSLSVHLGLGIEEFCAVWSKNLGKAQVYFAEFNKFYARALGFVCRQRREVRVFEQGGFGILRCCKLDSRRNPLPRLDYGFCPCLS